MNTNTTTQKIPGIRLYHANGRGTGCALRITARAASRHQDGALFLTFINQLTIGDREKGIPPKWDGDGRQSIRLDIVETGELLQVLRGELEQIADGRGIVHRQHTTKTTKTLKFRHVVDPFAGYVLELYTHKDEGADTAHRFVLNGAESLVLAEAIGGEVRAMAFGDPTASDHESQE